MSIYSIIDIPEKKEKKKEKKFSTLIRLIIEQTKKDRYIRELKKSN